MTKTMMMVMTRRRMMVLLMGLVCSHTVHAQNPYFNTDNDPANANAQNNIFYFDSNSDCNSPIRELYGFEATIKGADISSTRLGPTTCTIRLRSQSQHDGTVLDIEVKAMNILDCTTQVAIYDGDGANLLLMSYDCRSSQNQNKKRFLTSGDTATFIMTRQNVNSVNFDIEIKILPVRGGIDPGYENDWGTNFYFDKFSQEAIVGIIGGFYLLIIAVCSVFILMSFRSFQGKNKQWEVHQLATIKTGTTFEPQSQPSQVWSMGGAPSRGPNSQYSRSTQPYKQRPPPSEDGDSGVFYNDDAFQKRRLMNEEKERERARPRYVSSNASYTEPEEDSDHFVEKVITPRVRTANHRNRRPPSYEEAISDHPSERSSEEESEVSSSDTSVRKKPLSSEGSRSSRSRSSRSRTPSETESDEETESDDDRSSRDRGAKARRRRPKPHKSKRRDSRDHAGPSRSNRPHPQQAPQPQQLQMQPGAYAPYPPGQFVPVMAGPQFQPVQMVPGYPPPHYPEEHQAAPPPRGPQVQPTEPPVYSYLVRRGYTPLDARSNSPASTADSHRSGGGRLEEPELRLDSGVEYMRR